MTRRLAAALSAVLLAGLLVAALPAQAAPVPAGATWTEVWFPSEDGTLLHADVFLPTSAKKGARLPVILSIGPYFGTGGGMPPVRTGPAMRFGDLIEEGRSFERGYAYVQVDSRGFGSSEGCQDFGGPGEQSDAKAAVEWAATQKWSNGKVGMWGKSYDASTQVMALAQKPRGLAAAVIQSPLIESYRGLYMNGVHYEAGWYAAPSNYVTYDLTPPSVVDSPPEEFVYPLTGTATNPQCYAEQLAMTKVPERNLAYWKARDVVKAAGQSRVPVMWSHGLLDDATKPDNFLDVYSKLRGPKRVWVGQYGHVRGNESTLVGRAGFMEEAMAWFDHYLKGLPLKRYPNAVVQDGEGDWRSESQWPPSDAKNYPLALRPGSFLDLRDGDAADETESNLWSFTQPAPYDLHFAGTPRLNLELETLVPNANVIARVYDFDRDGTGRLITRGAYRVPGSGETSFDLYPQDWRLPKGHRIGVQLSGNDEAWFSPIPTNTPVTVTGGALELPFLRYLRPSNLEGWAAQAMGGVPTRSFPDETIEAAEVKVEFPARLRKR